MWPKRKIQGFEYEFSHLSPFNMPVPQRIADTRELIVGVSFGLHVFTRERQEEDKPDLWYNEGNDLRSFCPVRHGLSLNLPDLIKAQAEHKAYFSDDRPFLIIDPKTRLEADGPYCVFFNLERANRKARSGTDVRMFVVSAYRKPNLPDNLPVVYFSTLAAKVAKGEPVKRPR